MASEPTSSASPTPSNTTELTRQPNNTHLANTLIGTILSRHTTRAFDKVTPVPIATLEECLELAQHSPSSTNFQPWELTFTSGPKLESLRTKLVEAVRSGVKSTIPPPPDKFRPKRSGLGHVLYGPTGYDIPRSDKEAMTAAVMRNYEFFDAPMVAVVGMDDSLMARSSDVMSVGLYVQTLVLLLTERGLGTCLEVSTSGYADLLREELGIPSNIHVLCTLAIGYEDETKRVNSIKMERDTWRDHAKFVME